jgi:L-ascorbate metabolism protein UlaG (beta-lactamase superfamily)
MPIGAYDPRWFMRGVHLDPEEAVQAYRDLRSAHDRNPVRQIMMAVHWGTYKLTDEPMDEPPARARAAWRRAGLPEEDLWILAQGETKVLGAEC